MSETRTYPIVKYNEAGLEIYREEANGYWVKREYDEKGRQTYWETNRNGWAKHQYDDDGREIYYENSDGFWFKAEYNKDGFRIYYEDSTGKVTSYKDNNFGNFEELLSDAQQRSSVNDMSEDKSVNEKEM